MSDPVIQFPSQDALDRTGHEVLSRLKQAAAIAEQNTQHAITLAHQASMQLRVAEDKLARLELEISSYKERAERAEGWLQRISQEIEQTFSSRKFDAYAPRRANI